MYPGLPSSLRAELVITGQVDEECQANIVLRAGKPFGVWLDDTTPNLEHWVKLAAAKYGPLEQKVLVAVAPHDAGKRHGPASTVINVYEYYPDAGSPDEPPVYEAYCLQWLWGGPDSRKPPAAERRDRWLAAVQKHHPRFILLF